jgi:hypothetical protein
MRYFTQYWKNTTWRLEDDPAPLRFAASNQFAKRGVSPGDRVFVITNDGGRLLLGAALDVAAVLSPAAAKREFGSDVWLASHYIKARSPAKFTRENVVPTKIVRALRFEGGGQVVFQGSKIHQQTLRGVRELTTESAELLDRLLRNPSAPGVLARTTSLSDSSSSEAEHETLASLFELYPAQARRSVQDALINAIRYAHRHYPDRWTLNRTGKRIRFNVGMVMCAEVCSDHTGLLTTVAGRQHDPDWSESGYTYGPGCGYVTVPAATPFPVSSALQAAVNAAIDVCARAHPGTGRYRGKNPEALLRFLERERRTKLPRPDWLSAESEKKSLMTFEKSLAAAPDLERPEREAVAKYRCAQGLFRRRVLVLEASRCRVTEETNPDLLRASHIKPWRTSDDTEKQDGDNGLLLAPHVDALFDKGLISFADDGSMLLSEGLDSAVLQRWGIRYPLNVGPFREGQKKYLRHHRRTHRFGRK